MAKISVERAYLVADKIGEDFVVPTLARRLWSVLDLAEERYGPRDPRWTIMGAEFYPTNGEVFKPAGQPRLMVRIPLTAIDYPIVAYHFLAHEVVHLLLFDDAKVPVLEEGLCEMFAADHIRECFRTNIGDRQHPRYLRAEDLVRSFLYGAPDRIRKLRAIDPSLKKLRPEHLLEVAPGAGEQLVSDLLAPFWGEGEYERELEFRHQVLGNSPS